MGCFTSVLNIKLSLEIRTLYSSDTQIVFVMVMLFFMSIVSQFAAARFFVASAGLTI